MLDKIFIGIHLAILGICIIIAATVEPALYNQVEIFDLELDDIESVHFQNSEREITIENLSKSNEDMLFFINAVIQEPVETEEIAVDEASDEADISEEELSPEEAQDTTMEDEAVESEVTTSEDEISDTDADDEEIQEPEVMTEPVSYHYRAGSNIDSMFEKMTPFLGRRLIENVSMEQLETFELIPDNNGVMTINLTNGNSLVLEIGGTHINNTERYVLRQGWGVYIVPDSNIFKPLLDYGMEYLRDKDVHNFVLDDVAKIIVQIDSNVNNPMTFFKIENENNPSSPAWSYEGEGEQANHTLYNAINSLVKTTSFSSNEILLSQFDENYQREIQNTYQLSDDYINNLYLYATFYDEFDRELGFLKVGQSSEIVETDTEPADNELSEVLEQTAPETEIQLTYYGITEWEPSVFRINNSAVESIYQEISSIYNPVLPQEIPENEVPSPPQSNIQS